MPTRGNDRNRGGFQYRERSSATVQRRANQSGGAFDSLFRSDVDVVSIKEGDWRLRICPPSWNDHLLEELGIVHPTRSDDWDPEGADDFGLEVYVHFSVGADNQKYFCLKKMKGEACPVCEERERVAALGAAGMSMADKDFDDYIRNLQPTKRVIAYVIDRDERNSGPQLWNMAWSMDRDLNKLSMDKETREAVCIDHPEEGFDLEFSVTGTGIKTKYGGIAIARRSTPLSDNPDRQDDWLRTIAENPIPELLTFHDYEHIKAALAGQRRNRDEGGDDRRGGGNRGDDRRHARDDDDGDRGSRSRARDIADDDDDNRARRPAIRGRDADVDDDPPPARGRGRDRDDHDDDPPPARAGRNGGRSREADADVDDDRDPPPARDTGHDDAPPARRRSSRAAEEATDPPARETRSRSRDADADDAPPARTSLRDRVAEGRRRSES